MGDNAGFDETEAEGVEALYTTEAAERRRAFVRRQLDPNPGESVLSIGCGPGFEPAELVETVGDAGRVHAIDASQPMLELAERRCDDERVTLAHGDATDLPLEDASFDAATSVQVYEYLTELDEALSELRRVLRPGGRAAIYATDWESLVWNVTDRARSNRVAATWAGHCARPHLGSTLRKPLRNAGLDVERIEPFTVVETELQDSFAGYMRAIIRSYAAEHGDADDAEAWGDDLRDRDDAGETLFSLTAFLYLVSKPA